MPSIHKHLPDLADQRHPQRKVEHAHGNSQPNQSSQYCARGEDRYRFKSILWPMHKDKDQHHRYSLANPAITEMKRIRSIPW